jgi:hypothetical protein
VAISHQKHSFSPIKILGIVLFLLSPLFLFAQQDSTQQIKARLAKTDSADNKLNHKIDSVQSRVNAIFNPNLNQLGKNVRDKNKAKRDSITFYKKRDKEKRKIQAKLDDAKKNNQSTEKYITQLDSLDKVKYDPHQSNTLSPQQKLNALKQKATHPADSLKGINPSLSSTKLTNKIDSLEQVGPMKQINSAESKISQTEQKLNAPVNKAEGVMNEKLSLMNKEGGTGANLPGNVNVPDAGLKTDLHINGKTNLPSADLNVNNPLDEVNNPLKNELGEAGGKVSEVKGIPQEQISKIKSIEEVKGAQSKLGEANAITDKAQGYGNDVKNLSQGNLNEVKDAPKALEQQATKLDEVKGIQKEAGQLDQYKGMATKGNDPEAMKQLAMQQAQASFTPPTNHFAGQEQVLQKAMDDMSKLKSKYTELNSLKDIPKRKPNEMRGKPFIERIVPGITLQVQKNKDVLIDYNPYLGYRFYGKFTAGAGWNERFNVGKHFYFSLKDRIYGPRVFADYKIGKGFSVRTDIEKMNTFIPSVSGTGLNGDPDHRAWVWSAFVGIKKEYKFWGSVRGNAQFLYNLYDDHHNSPYGDRVVVRMGFEFPLKKKTKPSADGN